MFGVEEMTFLQEEEVFMNVKLSDATSTEEVNAIGKVSDPSIDEDTNVNSEVEEGNPILKRKLSDTDDVKKVRKTFFFHFLMMVYYLMIGSLLLQRLLCRWDMIGSY